MPLPSKVLLAASLIIAPFPVLAQTCRDVPRLLGEIQGGMKTVNADAPAERALRQFGGVCPAAKRVHAALNGLLFAADKDPNRCGATPDQVERLRNLKQYLDLHSDCGLPGH